MSKLIKNSEFIKAKIDECVKLESKENSNDNLVDKDLIEILKSSKNDELISLDLLKKLKNFWNKNFKDSKLFIHELLSETELYLPRYEPPERSPELIKRIEEIKAQLEEESYQNMVYNVDLNSPLRLSKDKLFNTNTSLFPEFRTLQGQLIAIFNTFAVIIGSFFFGYKAVEYSLNEPNFTKQIFGGFLIALIVAIADIYILLKKLSELDDTTDISKKKKPTKSKPVKTATKSTKILQTINSSDIKSTSDKKSD